MVVSASSYLVKIVCLTRWLCVPFHSNSIPILFIPYFIYFSCCLSFDKPIEQFSMPTFSSFFLATNCGGRSPVTYTLP